MELTKETFDDFVARLRYHHKGEGVDDHFTRDPIFIVQSRKRVYGFDGSIHVCPQPEGREHPSWNYAPLDVCDVLGLSLSVTGLDADGGAGR